MSGQPHPYDRSFILIRNDSLFKIMTANNLTSLAIFISLFFIFTLIAVYEIYMSIVAYIESPISTSYTTITHDKIPLPEIYLCSPGRITFDGKRKFGDKFEHAEKLRRLYFDRNFVLEDDSTETTLSEWSNFTAQQMHQVYLEGNIQGATVYLYCMMRTNVNKQMLCKTIYTTVFDPEYGRCFLIHLNNLDQETYGQGLLMILNLRFQDFKNLTPSELQPKFLGLHVAVAEKIDPTNAGETFLVPRGVYTKLDLYREDLNFLNVDSGPNIQLCTDADDFEFKILRANYSADACKLECKLDWIAKSQRCILPYDEHFYKNATLKEYKFCSPQEVKIA